MSGIEIEGCARCGGKLMIIVSIEEPQAIAKVLSHLQRTASAGLRFLDTVLLRRNISY